MQLVGRCILFYVIIVVALRLMGKREVKGEDSLKVTIKTDKPKKISETDKKKEEAKPKKD